MGLMRFNTIIILLVFLIGCANTSAKRRVTMNAALDAIKSNPDCGKWVFYKSTGKKINSLEDALTVYQEFLHNENQFLNVRGFYKRYGFTPFLITQEIKDKNGKYVKKEAYYMGIIANLIDKEGNVYSYVNCE